MSLAVPRVERSLDAWLAPAAVLVLGAGVVMLLAGLGAGEEPLALAGVAAAVLALLVLMAAGWVDGLVVLIASLPLPALLSSESVRLAPAALMTGLLLLAWLLGTAPRPATRPDFGSLPRRPALALLAAVFLSTLFARHTFPAVRELLNFALLLALLAIATLELRRVPGRVARLARGIAAVAGAAGAVGVLQAVGAIPAPFVLPGTSFHRATFGFGWPNEFGVFMALALPLAVHVYRTSTTRSGRLWTGAALLFATLGLAATFSRGSWLALVVAAPILLLVGERRLVARILLATAAVVAMDVALGGALHERIISTLQDPYVVQRLALTFTGVLMFLANPLVGVGPGNFGEHLNEFGPSVTWLWDYVGTAHNAYVDMAAETGVIGLVALVAFMATLLLRLLRSARDARADETLQPADRSLRYALLWSFAVACAAGFAVWPFAHGIGQLVMVVAAMGIALDRSRATAQ